MRREGIVAWVQKKSGPPTVTVSEVAALTDLEQEAPAIAVGYFTELAVRLGHSSATWRRPHADPEKERQR